MTSYGDSKQTQLKALKERDLCIDVLLPLLNRMGLKGPTLTHGPNELGKDIVCFNLDPLGEREYIAVVVKTHALNGAVSSEHSLFHAVATQVRQCFDNPHVNLFGVQKIRIDRVWVITSAEISHGAPDKIIDMLRKDDLDKLVRFISGDELVRQIDRHFPEYWSRDPSSLETTRRQLSNLQVFARRLMAEIGLGQEKIDSLITEALFSLSVPGVRTPKDLIPWIPPFDQLVIDKINHPFGSGMYSHECGSVALAFSKAKRSIAHAFNQWNDAIETAEDALKTPDPWRLVKLFKDKLVDDDPFRRLYCRAGFDPFHDVETLEAGLREIDQFVAALKAKGKLEWALSLFESVELAKPEITEFLLNVDSQSFTLNWFFDYLDPSPTLRLSLAAVDSKSSTQFSTEHSSNQGIEARRGRDSHRTTPDEVLDEVRDKLRTLIDCHIGYDPFGA